MVSKSSAPSAPVAEPQLHGHDLLADARLQELLAPAGRR